MSTIYVYSIVTVRISVFSVDDFRQKYNFVYLKVRSTNLGINMTLTNEDILLIEFNNLTSGIEKSRDKGQLMCDFCFQLHFCILLIIRVSCLVLTEYQHHMKENKIII